jgi:hypothetical protein
MADLTDEELKKAKEELRQALGLIDEEKEYQERRQKELYEYRKAQHIAAAQERKKFFDELEKEKKRLFKN